MWVHWEGDVGDTALGSLGWRVWGWWRRLRQTDLPHVPDPHHRGGVDQRSTCDEQHDEQNKGHRL